MELPIGTGEVWIEKVPTEATNLGQEITGVKAIPASKLSGKLVTASEEASFEDTGASSHGIESSRDEVFVEDKSVKELMGKTKLKHFLPSELVYDSKNSPNGHPWKRMDLFQFLVVLFPARHSN